MKKIIFGIFAHPDDEAFGPSGTLLMEAKAGNEVHLITLTAGEAGTNPDDHEDLADVRLDEWKKAGRLIGASSMEFFGYKDGQLCNNDMIEIGVRLVDYITGIIKSADESCEIELMSIDLNGITGHIDHIVAARASCWAFYQLKLADPRINRLRLACISDESANQANTNWLFMEPGRTPNEIGETIDARSYRHEIIEIMKCHHSQRADFASHIKDGTDHIGLNHFVVIT